MNRKATLLVLGVFLLGIALGAVGMHFAGARNRPLGHGPARMQEQLTQELALTSDQQKQLAVILEDIRHKFDAIYQPIRPQMEQARQEGRARIRAILTPEQLPKFEAYMRRIDEERKKREGR